MDDQEKKENAKKVAKMINLVECGPMGIIRASVLSLGEMSRFHVMNQFLPPSFASGFNVIEKRLAELKEQYGTVLYELQSHEECYPDRRVVREKISTIESALKDVEKVSQVLAGAKETLRTLPIKIFS